METALKTELKRNAKSMALVIGVGAGLALSTIIGTDALLNFEGARSVSAIESALRIPRVAQLKGEGYEIVSDYDKKLEECRNSGMAAKVEMVLPSKGFIRSNTYAMRCESMDALAGAKRPD
jgi:hypothetical protein